MSNKVGDVFKFFGLLTMSYFIGRNNGVRESGNKEMLKDKRLKSSKRHLCFLGQLNDYDTKWGQNHPKVVFEFSYYSDYLMFTTFYLIIITYTYVPRYIKKCKD